ncbi:hypothetical protein EWM64_g5948 [Hericium alpestre]|uniref:Uncharacterized protein n=1 Tax=Hericium alpestre TaxID=135208 RepID=A0A4Y9ZUZ7_9AGAM|nr:hypothetical protein EWM64_g5948 [Hericium alpestre]
MIDIGAYEGIRTPVVLAPMSTAAGGALAAHVTLGGGFGFLASQIKMKDIGVSYEDADHFRAEFGIARAALNIPHGPLPIGAGFLGFMLEQQSDLIELLDIALENRVRAIILALSNDTKRWVDYIRKYDQKAGDNHKTLVFTQVGTLTQAITAINDWKVDVLVAQGNESGGHGWVAAPSLFTLVSQIIAAFPGGVPLPVLAAGGIINGAQVAAYLTLGASGAVLGTRFVLTPETQYPEPFKQAIIAADPSSTVRSELFDVMGGFSGFPDGIDGRALRIAAIQKVAEGRDLKEVKEEFLEGMQKGQLDSMIIFAGAGSGLAKKVKPAQDIVRELHGDIVKRLQASSRVVSVT